MSFLVGENMVCGYGGADIFVFTDGFGADTILDFVDGSDMLDFTGHTGVDAFGDLTVTESGADAVVADGFGNQITMTGAAGLVDGADFLF